MKSTSVLAFSVTCLLAASACDSVTKGKPKAEVTNSTAAAPASAAPTTATLETLAVSPETSKVLFVGSRVTGHHDCKFNEFSGTIQLVGGKPEAGKVDVSIDMASVETDAEKLTRHLKSADFFDVEKYPKATFVSTEVTKGGSGGASHTIKGNLTLHGVTKGISFPATLTVNDTEVTAKSEFSINRKDFNITYPGKPDDLIKDDVLIKLDMRFPRKK